MAGEAHEVHDRRRHGRSPRSLPATAAWRRRSWKRERDYFHRVADSYGDSNVLAPPLVYVTGNPVVGPGNAIYAPAGIAGSHEWQVGADGLQLLSIRAALEGHKRMQFTVDRETRRSYIELDELVKMEGVKFDSHY